jgi:hypothetical protein
MEKNEKRKHCEEERDPKTSRGRRSANFEKPKESDSKERGEARCKRKAAKEARLDGEKSQKAKEPEIHVSQKLENPFAIPLFS